MSRIQSFRDLLVWQKSMDLVEDLYGITRRYPDEERFGLTCETRKTARSIPYNVAEGKSRRTTAEYHQGVSIAIGSMGELQTQLILAGRVKYIPGEVLSNLEERTEEIARMLRGLEECICTAKYRSGGRQRSGVG